MTKPIIALAVMAATLASAAIVAAPAEARQRGHSFSVQGSNGRGLVGSRSISRQPGSVAASRSIQTNGGYGYQHSRSANWGDGAYSASRGTTFNNGTSVGRTTSAVNNGDGTASYTSTRNGINGNSRTVSGTVTRSPQ